MERNESNLDKWCKGKAAGVVALGRWLAIGADASVQMLIWMREGAPGLGLGDVESEREWLKLYRQHRRIRRVLGGLLPLGKPDTKAVEMLEGLQEAQRLAAKMGAKKFNAMVQAERKRMGKEAWKEMWREIQEYWKEIGKRADKAGEVNEAELEAAIKQLEVVFFMRVWWPCWLEYGEYPTKLMRRARQGDLDAIDKVLRMDKGAIQDPKIAVEWHQASVAYNKARFDVMQKALAEGPRGKLTRRIVKVSMGALVSKLADGLAKLSKTFPPKLRAKRLKATEIRGLFDAVAKDKGELRDFDLPPGDEALAKDLQRQKPFWKVVPETGQK